MTPLLSTRISPQQLQALCGLSARALETLLDAAVPILLQRRREAQAVRPKRQRAVGGGRTRRLSPTQEILLTLVYLRHNVAHAVVGALFGVSADTSENTFQEVVAVLQEVCPAQRWAAQKRWKKGEPSWQPTDVERVLVDSFETPIRRPSQDAAQRRVYSGKRRRHTLKTQVVTDGTGEVLEVSGGHRGPAADKTVYEHSQVPQRYPAAQIYGDLAYLGGTRIETPTRKPPRGAWAPEQQAANRELAQLRVYVEHGIRRLKGYRILRGDYRLALGSFGKIAVVVAGLLHLSRLVGS